MSADHQFVGGYEIDPSAPATCQVCGGDHVVHVPNQAGKDREWVRKAFVDPWRPATPLLDAIEACVAARGASRLALRSDLFEQLKSEVRAETDYRYGFPVRFNSMKVLEVNGVLITERGKR